MLSPVPKISVTSATSPVTLAVRQISLQQFRNYAELRLDLAAAPVVLTGQNGSGKTNLLEAISLLVPGRGLRRGALSEFQKLHDDLPWGVATILDTPQGELRIGTGRDPETPEQDRRVVHIDGRPAKNQQVLAEHVALAWVTPEMDRVLADGAAGRRKWLDRLVYSFDAGHAGRVQRYEKALRERLLLLREGRVDAAWLNALEDNLAQTGVAIAAARRQLVQQLQSAIDATTSVFPQAELALSGQAENWLDQFPALLVEDRLRETYAAARYEDGQSGSSSIGPQRSDWLVTHRAKQAPAALCSTGEQKALIIAIMLAYTQLLRQVRQMTPLLLLDDITAHLDETRRAALFEVLRDLGVQAWLTGTDPAHFAPLLNHAQHYRVEQGRVG